MFKDLDEVKLINKANGYHWFKSKTMSIFQTLLLSPLMNFTNGSGKHFQVFSFSDFNNSNKPLFNIAKVEKNGEISVIGKVKGYSSEREAWENLGNDLNNYL